MTVVLEKQTIKLDVGHHRCGVSSFAWFSCKKQKEALLGSTLYRGSMGK